MKNRYSQGAYNNVPKKRKGGETPQYSNGLSKAGSLMGGVGGLMNLYGAASGSEETAKWGSALAGLGSAVGTVGGAMGKKPTENEVGKPQQAEQSMAPQEVQDDMSSDLMKPPVTSLELTPEDREFMQMNNYNTFRDGVNNNGARGLMAKYGCYMKPGRKANGKAK